MFNVVPALPMIPDPTIKLPPAKKGCLKLPEDRKMTYNINYVADPDVNDRGRLRFPGLNVSGEWKAHRTCSPPPRSDDPDNLIDENRRRREGHRMQGPSNKAGYPINHEYIRNVEWELALPDNDSVKYQDQQLLKRHKRAASPDERPTSKRRRSDEGMNNEENRNPRREKGKCTKQPGMSREKNT